MSKRSEVCRLILTVGLSAMCMGGVSAALALALGINPPRSASRSEQPLVQIGKIPLPGVEGRIDHFGIDLDRRRLFMSALGNNTVEILDLKTNKRVGTIHELREPQGVLYVPAINRVFVGNAQGGAVDVFDGNTLRPVGEVKYTDDADNIRYDASAKLVYIGYGDGAIGVIDASSDKRLHDIKLEAHPESFQLETSGSRMFVNVPDAGYLEVVDRTKQAVIAKWRIEGARANFPMALDEADQRLFITCRRPPQVMVFDTASGKVLARLPVVGDADDMFYDLAHRRIYVSGGEGAISVIDQRDPDHYQVIGRIPTAPGARTSFFVPALNRLYVAVPHRGTQPAEVRVFEVR
ncbi:MAG TPA: YncE family protein [Terriglobia bacterium]|nr:YncE family protein [Terriglobia bacterium]